LAQLGPLGDGSHVLTAYAEDIAGNFSAPAVPLALTIDTIAPDTPVFALDPGEDSSDPTDGVTSVSTLDFRSTGEPGTELDMSMGGLAADGTLAFAPAGATLVGPDGRWTMSAGPLADGLYLFDARLVDLAGNVS